MDSKTLINKFVGTAGVLLISKGLAVLIGIIYARYLGPEEYGLYGYVMSIVTLLTLPTIAGLPNLIIREIANYHLEKKWGYLKGIIKWSRIYIISVSAIVLAIAYLAIYFDYLNTATAHLLSLALVLVPILGLITQQGAILNGFRKPVLAQVPIGILIPIITLVVLLFIIIKERSITSYLIIQISIISSIAALILSAFFLNRNQVKEQHEFLPEYKLKSWHKSLTPFTLIAIVATLNTELAAVILGWLDSPESVAYFKVAMQGTLLVSLSLASVNSVIMPSMARFYNNGDFNALQELVTKSVRLSCIVALPIIFTLLIFGGFLIKKLFGVEYSDAYFSLIILCVGQVVNVMMGSVGSILSMINKERYVLKSMCITLILTLMLLFFLIPAYSQEGAAIAVSFGLILWNIIMARDLYKLTKIKSWLR